MMPSSNTQAQKDDKSRNKVFLGPSSTQELFLDEKNTFSLAEKPLIANEKNKQSGNSTVFMGAEATKERKLKDMSSLLRHSEKIQTLNHKDTVNTQENVVFTGATKTRELLLSDVIDKVHSVEKKKLLTKSAKENASETRVFLGPESTKEAQLDQLAENLKWTEKAKDEYLKRVKEKATIGVKNLLLNAQKKADEIISHAHQEVENIQVDAKKLHKEAEENALQTQKAHDDAKNTLVEAENIKEQAYEEGYNAGLHQAQIHLEEAKKEIANSMSSILLSIHEQCITIFNSWREDLVSLLHEAVETSTGYIMDTEKKALLQNVLESSVNALLNKREYQVRANPNDAILLTEILEQMQNNLRQNSNWSLVTDEHVEEGSVVVESPSGVIQNTTKTRENLVRQILDQLTLPLSDGDQIAYDNISQTLVEEAQKANIPLHGEEYQAESAPVPDMTGMPDMPDMSDMSENAPVPNLADVADVADVEQSQTEIAATPATENTAENEIVPEEMIEKIEENQNIHNNQDIHAVKAQENQQAQVNQQEIPSEHENMAQGLSHSEMDDVFASENNLDENILQAKEDLIPKASEEMQEMASTDILTNSPLSAEEMASALADELVEKDLNFESLDGFIASDLPNANKNANNNANQKKEAKAQSSKPEYTPELADELLNEMGF